MKIIIYTKEKKYEFESIYAKNYLYALRHVHRENGPAIIKYYENGNIQHKSWCLNGEKHRKNGPAFVEYNNNNKRYESWYLNGVLHRTDGPAIIWYNNNGKIEYKEYYINGNSYSIIKFTQELLKRKIQLI